MCCSNKKCHSKNYSVALKDLRGKELQELFKELKTEAFDLTPSSQILESPNATFSFNKSNSKLLNGIIKRTKPFEEYCDDVANGISTSCDEIYIVDAGFAKANKFEKKYLKPSQSEEAISINFIVLKKLMSLFFI